MAKTSLSSNARIITWIHIFTKIVLASLFPQKNDSLVMAVGQFINHKSQSSFDVRKVLSEVLNVLADRTQADMLAVFRFNRLAQRFELLRSCGSQLGFLAKVGSEIGMNDKTFFPDNQPLWNEDLQRYPSNHQLINWLDKEGLRSYCILPLFAHNELIGVLEIAWRAPQYTKIDYIEFLTRIAEQIAFAVERTFAVGDHQQSNLESATRTAVLAEGLLRALELRDPLTEEHTRRVSLLTMRLVAHMQIPSEQWDAIWQGALLHDIGKIGIPDAILLKTGSLTTDERKKMEQHVIYGYSILTPIIQLQNTLDIVLYHHERWDGLGYPHGLRGDQIPLVARLFAVVDVFDALTSDRPYRRAWSRAQTLDYIREQAGNQFDPKIVQLFQEIAYE